MSNTYLAEIFKLSLLCQEGTWMVEMSSMPIFKLVRVDFYMKNNLVDVYNLVGLYEK